MKIKKRYMEVAKEVDAGNYDVALKLFDKVRKNDRDSYYIEAQIYNGLKNSVREYRALKKLLPLLPCFSPEDKKIYEYCLWSFCVCCSQLALIDESIKISQRMINTVKDKKLFHDLIVNLCFDINTKEDASAEDFQAIYDKFRNSFNFEPFPRRFYQHDKIRVGFLSGDFYRHVVMNWSWAMLTKLDKNRFEVYAYSNTKKQDEVTESLRSSVESWRDIREMTDKAAAELIRDDEIDILFDLSGNTENERLGIVAYRPATVQISGIGLTSSTGLKTVDYFLTDEYCVGDSAPYFVENLIAMSNTHVCYMPFGEMPLPIAEEPPCKKNGYVTFGSFNQYRKITDSMLIAWKRILDAVPNSRLLLKHKTYGMEDGKEFVDERLKSVGFDLARVELRGFSYRHPFDYDDMDIALDTFPYTGVTTTMDALLMGVPVVSLYGDRHATRCGLSLLNNVGLKELAVDSYDEYVKRAIALASDWELLSILRKNLRTMIEKSPLMDLDGYVREIEQAFIEVLDAARNAE